MVQNKDFDIQNLIDSLSSYNDLVRVEARKALVAMGKPIVPSLIEALRGGPSLARLEAVKALGAIEDPSIAPVLVKALEDEEFDIRWLAAKSLSEMDVKGLRPLLQALAERPDSAYLREGAHHVLHDLAKGELGQYVGPVLHALDDTPSRVPVPEAASRALEMLEMFHEKVMKPDASFLKQFAVPVPTPSALGASPHGVTSTHHHSPRRSIKSG